MIKLKEKGTKGRGRENNKKTQRKKIRGKRRGEWYTGGFTVTFFFRERTSLVCKREARDQRKGRG